MILGSGHSRDTSYPYLRFFTADSKILGSFHNKETSYPDLGFSWQMLGY
jgi:hypothetical protein